MRSLLVIVALLGTASCRPGGKEGAAPAVERVIDGVVEALTVTPAMSLLLLPAVAARQRRDGPLVRALHAAYCRVLPVLVQRSSMLLS